ncbi:MAG TPA: hypothetical protein VE198_12630, partial [Actinoallomurus sp.]|nr:hypothetical protein [Actinoallomurus sp.]
MPDVVGSCRPSTDGRDAPLTHDAPTVFEDLNTQQADGRLCVRARCQADFWLSGIAAIPVGISATTGSQVFACEDLCAAAVGYRPPAGEQMPLEAECVVCGPGCCSP